MRHMSASPMRRSRIGVRARMRAGSFCACARVARVLHDMWASASLVRARAHHVLCAYGSSPRCTGGVACGGLRAVRFGAAEV